MALDSDYVTEKLGEQPFEILKMEEGEGSVALVLTIVHELYPDQEFLVSLLSEDTDGDDEDDTMVLQFDGPDVFTDIQAKEILQQVMDTLVNIIDSNLEDNPELVPPEDNEGESGESNE